jgi:hypothetical protein
MAENVPPECANGAAAARAKANIEAAADRRKIPVIAELPVRTSMLPGTLC